MSAQLHIQALIAPLALLASLGSPPPCQAANLLKNGGFETPLVPVGGFTGFATGQDLSKWTVVGEPGNVAVVSGSFVQSGISFIAKAGTQWLDLTGNNSNRPTGVQQSAKTVVGTTYRLTFSVGNVVDAGHVFGAGSTVQVLLNGSPFFMAVHTAGNATSLSWKTFRVNFTATSSRTTIAFINADPLDDNSNGLDAVSLTSLGP